MLFSINTAFNDNNSHQILHNVEWHLLSNTTISYFMSISSSALTNISQVLLRNVELLTSTSPLFINLINDGFIERFIEDNPQANVSCYNTNYIDYCAINNKFSEQITTSFTSEYTSKTLHDLVIVNFPKSKDELAFTLAMIAPYLLADATIIFVGEKKGGVQSAPKLAKHFVSNCQKIDAARHCLVFAGTVNELVTTKPFVLNDWFKNYQIHINNIELTIASLPGVFSQKKLDVGTALLLGNLPKDMQGKVLDFGCGAGVISCFIGKQFPKTKLNMLDVSALAITSSKKTLSLNGLSANVFASNSLSTVDEKFEHIVSNPPFHQGTKTSYKATEDFLSGIKAYMKPKADITIVANSFLQYLPIMEKDIGRTGIVTAKQGFNIYYCQNSLS